VWDAPDTSIAPNSGNTPPPGRPCLPVRPPAAPPWSSAPPLAGGRTLADVEGVDFHAEYTGITDKLGSPKEHPVSHIAYGYATHLWSWTPRGRWRG
jgi:hypothetical protein